MIVPRAIRHYLSDPNSPYSKLDIQEWLRALMDYGVIIPDCGCLDCFRDACDDLRLAVDRQSNNHCADIPPENIGRLGNRWRADTCLTSRESNGPVILTPRR